MITKNEQEINVRDMLPQKEPFVFIDGLLEIQKNKAIKTYKLLTTNDIFVANKNDPTFYPEILLVESAAQSIILLHNLSKENSKNENQKFFIGKFESEFAQGVNIGDYIVFNVNEYRIVTDKGFATVEIIKNNEVIGKVKVYFSSRKSL